MGSPWLSCGVALVMLGAALASETETVLGDMTPDPGLGRFEASARSGEPFSDASYHHDSMVFRSVQPDYYSMVSNSQDSEEHWASYSSRATSSGGSVMGPSIGALTGSPSDSSSLSDKSQNTDTPLFRGATISTLALEGIGGIWMAYHLYERHGLIKELVMPPYYCTEQDLKGLLNQDLQVRTTAGVNPKHPRNHLVNTSRSWRVTP